MTKPEELEKLQQAIEQEKQHIDETLQLFLETRAKKKPTKNDQVAISVYIHNLYMGMENIFRRILQFNGINIKKSDSYHKELLNTSIQSGIISQDMYDTIKEFMSFRHRVVHGYGYMVDPEKMRFLIENAESTVREFYTQLKRSGYLK